MSNEYDRVDPKIRKAMNDMTPKTRDRKREQDELMDPRNPKGYVIGNTGGSVTSTTVPIEAETAGRVYSREEIESMKKAELVTLANELGIEAHGSKSDYIDALLDHFGLTEVDEDDDGEDDGEDEEED